MSIGIFDSVERFWTAERVSELKRLFENGLSNNQIAVEMNIKSRNAVIGKLHRLGLNRDGSIETRGLHVSLPKKVRAAKPKPVEIPPPAPKPVPQKPARGGPELDVESIKDLAFETTATRIPLLAARANQCRWPAADDGSATMVCGEIASEGSYCRRHASLAVRYDSPKRRAAA
jgi:GcrA cell cycle regulator